MSTFYRLPAFDESILSDLSEEEVISASVIGGMTAAGVREVFGFDMKVGMLEIRFACRIAVACFS